MVSTSDFKRGQRLLIEGIATTGLRG